jgi:hypothetical protein
MDVHENILRVITSLQGMEEDIAQDKKKVAEIVM